MEFTVLAVIVVLLIMFVMIYNSLQRQGNKVKQSRADITASMKKRIDLVGRLIEITKSYGAHEERVQVASSANMASIGDAMAVSRQADRALNQVSSLAMAYPELKANATYQQLMSQLTDIETNLQSKREAYNNAVSAYNSYRSSLPQALFAAAIGFPEAPFYTVDEEGMESLPEFKTDDGKLLKDGVVRMGERAQVLAQQAGRKINTAIEDARGGQGGGTPAQIETKKAE